ncbi:hypothetical protein GCM10023231_12000 [Olivibacter ginsenosidimutans]|uniref:DUF2490 domain-containing protein n=1 Tax=Olivibacter ginsenosidimutans TaxID=1176537 RepID=A0ABP9ASQ6_9SPHI
MVFFSYTSRKTLPLVIILLLFTGYTGFAQNKFGITPQINVDFKIGTAWKVNSKLENRFVLHQNPYEGTGSSSEYDNTGIEVLVARNKGRLKNLGAGYLVRRSDKDGSFIHRAMQQYSLGQELGSLQLAHRFRSDQTFEKKEAVQYRLRYRISVEKPLNGLRVDPEEFYFKANNEYVGILKDGEGNLEIKLLTALGYNQSENNQIEMGLDYRAKNLIGSGMENQLWLRMGWYHSF